MPHVHIILIIDTYDHTTRIHGNIDFCEFNTKYVWYAISYAIVIILLYIKINMWKHIISIVTIEISARIHDLIKLQVVNIAFSGKALICFLLKFKSVVYTHYFLKTCGWQEWIGPNVLINSLSRYECEHVERVHGFLWVRGPFAILTYSTAELGKQIGRVRHFMLTAVT